MVSALGRGGGEETDVEFFGPTQPLGTLIVCVGSRLSFVPERTDPRLGQDAAARDEQHSRPAGRRLGVHRRPSRYFPRSPANSLPGQTVCRQSGYALSRKDNSGHTNGNSNLHSHHTGSLQLAWGFCNSNPRESRPDAPAGTSPHNNLGLWHLPARCG